MSRRHGAWHRDDACGGGGNGGKRALLDMMQLQAAVVPGGGCESKSMSAHSFLKTVPLPEIEYERPAKRPARSESQYRGFGSACRRPLAELGPMDDKEREREMQQARNIMDTSAHHVIKNCNGLEGSKGAWGGWEQRRAQAPMSDARNRNSATEGRGDLTLPAFFSDTWTGPFTACSRASFLEAIVRGSVCPPLHVLWLAHSRGVMPLQQIVMHSSDALLAHLAALLRSACLHARRHRPRGALHHVIPAATAANTSLAATNDKTFSVAATTTAPTVHGGREGGGLPGKESARGGVGGDALVLRQLLRIVVLLAFPGTPGGTSFPADAGRGLEGFGGGADICGRVSRKCLSMFDQLCCPPSTGTAAADSAPISGAPMSGSPVSGGVGDPLEATLAFVLAVHDAFVCGGGRGRRESRGAPGAESDGQDILKAVACNRLKHLRFQSGKLALLVQKYLLY
jgi:hypothetical protein